MEGLERLKGQMQSMKKSIARAVSGMTAMMNYNAHPFPSGDLYS
jgi:hypothetical protein